MSGLLIVVLAVAVLVAGCNQPPSGPRYQIARINDHSIVRLDTHTGDMFRFVAVVDGDVAAPSQVRVVHEAAAVHGCEELGHVGPAERGTREVAAVKGGDTILYGKSKAGTDEAWAYKCRKVAPSR